VDLVVAVLVAAVAVAVVVNRTIIVTSPLETLAIAGIVVGLGEK
jgi:hypothetical protein